MRSLLALLLLASCATVPSAHDARVARCERQCLELEWGVEQTASPARPGPDFCQRMCRESADIDPEN